MVRLVSVDDYGEKGMEQGRHVDTGGGLYSDVLIKGVISEGLRRWAMCSRRPAEPGGP